MLPVNPHPFLNEEQRNLFVWNSEPTRRQLDGTASHLELVASVFCSQCNLSPSFIGPMQVSGLTSTFEGCQIVHCTAGFGSCAHQRVWIRRISWEMETGSTKVIVNIIYPGGVHSNISEFCLLELPSDPRRGGLFPVNDAQLQECRRVQVSE
jgi:hypothetical protein